MDKHHLFQNIHDRWRPDPTMLILSTLLYRSARLRIPRELRLLSVQLFLGTLAMGAYLLVLRQRQWSCP